MNIIRILAYIWQLPQNIIGFLMSRNCVFKSFLYMEHSEFPIYFTNNVFGAGVCLGDYILLDYTKYCGKGSATKAKMHEYGHHRQSLYLGWFYLFTIGILSLMGNIYDRLFHKKWETSRKIKWYYNQPWEKWADKLGGVTR